MKKPTSLSDLLITYRLYLHPTPPENVDVAHTTLRHIGAHMNSGRAPLLQAAAERALELTHGSTVGFSFEDKQSNDLAIVWAASAGVSSTEAA